MFLELAIDNPVNRHDEEKEVLYDDGTDRKDEEDHDGVLVVHPADLGRVLRPVVLEVIKSRKSVKKVGGNNYDERNTPGVVRVDLEPPPAFTQGKAGDKCSAHVITDDIHAEK